MMFTAARLVGVVGALGGVAALLGSSPSFAADRGVEKVTADAAAPALSLSVRVNGKAGRLLKALETGEALASGDLVEVVVGVDRPAYVYLVQRFPDGSAAVLHPEVGDLQLPGGLETRLPEPGAWYQLDDTVGEEHLYVVASERPLADADRAVADAIARVRTDGVLASAPSAEPTPAETAKPPAASTAPKPPSATPSAASAPQPAPPSSPSAAAPAAGTSRPPPTLLTFANRGLVKSIDEGHASIEADPSGIAIYHFWFRHEPARAPEDSP